MGAEDSDGSGREEYKVDKVEPHQSMLLPPTPTPESWALSNYAKGFGLFPRKTGTSTHYFTYNFLGFMDSLKFI